MKYKILLLLVWVSISVNAQTQGELALRKTVAAFNNDTTQLLAKRDTQKLANGIRSSINQSSTVASNGYYLFGQITTSTTLTVTSPEYILCSGNTTITLPSAAAAFSSGQGRKYYFYKADGITTLTIKDSGGGTLWTTTNFSTTASFISNGTGWFQIQ